MDTPKNILAEEWDASQPMKPPEGTPIIRPFKELTTFYPNDQANRDDVQWVVPYETRYLRPLGDNIARIFGVSLARDHEYMQMPEEAKAAHLSCVMTRAQIQETQTGIFEWTPLCVVVKYCIMVAVQVRIDRHSNQIEIPKCLLWAKAQQAYVPVFDEAAGKIENPGVLLQILAKYAQMEKLVSTAPFF